MDLSNNILKYYPFSSLIETNFWDVFCKNKLDHYKLNQSEVDIIGTFRNDLNFKSAIVNIDYQSFVIKSDDLGDNVYPIYGKMIIMDTIEDFKTKNKNDLINSFGLKIWNDIHLGNFRTINDISKCLNQLIFMIFADIKKYQFHYWFAFPAINFRQVHFTNRCYLSDVLSKECMESLVKNHQCLRGDKNFFLASFSNSSVDVYNLLDYEKIKDNHDDLILCFADPCTKSEYPGWPLRNLLAYAAVNIGKTQWKVLSYRINRFSCEYSLLFDINWTSSDFKTYPGCVGWERNDKNKLLPMKADLGATLDPHVIATNAVDLNLKLMRWRLVPDLDLDKIRKTKCLLLGSGTLGCNVARALMGWGVRNISFVDSGKVSFSNPVRQSLFDFNDCLQSGQYKAVAAAEKLKQIHPNIVSEGHVLNIPMPGHVVYVLNKEQTLKDCQTLETLIDENDCIFLLMDTRESRWLPTVIGQLVINAALGFDTFLVQRHGIPSEDLNDMNKLSCYFCSDVISPGDSTQNRSLDQQCTITRPGVSMIAGALAAELMISVIQSNKSESETDIGKCRESILGQVPHQIRGFLSQFSQIMPTSYAFSRCVACSPNVGVILVLEKYTKDRDEFIMQILENNKYLEELTGIRVMLQRTTLEDIIVLSDDDNQSD